MSKSHFADWAESESFQGLELEERLVSFVRLPVFIDLFGAGAFDGSKLASTQLLIFHIQHIQS